MAKKLKPDYLADISTSLKAIALELGSVAQSLRAYTSGQGGTGHRPKSGRPTIVSVSDATYDQKTRQESGQESWEAVPGFRRI